MIRIPSNYISVLISIAVYLVFSLLLLFMYTGGDYGGSDAAGNGMARGYAFLISFALYTLLSIVFVGFNLYLHNDSHPWWFKVLSYLPVLPWFYIISTIK